MIYVNTVSTEEVSQVERTNINMCEQGFPFSLPLHDGWALWVVGSNMVRTTGGQWSVSLLKGDALSSHIVYFWNKIIVDSTDGLISH